MSHLIAYAVTYLDKSNQIIWFDMLAMVSPLSYRCCLCLGLTVCATKCKLCWEVS